MAANTGSDNDGPVWDTAFWRLVVLGLLLAIIPFVFRMEWADFKPLFTWVSIRFLLIGVVATIVVSLAAIILSLPLATLLALGRIAPQRWISWPSIAFIEALRALPLLLLIFYINVRFPQLKALESVRMDDPASFMGGLVLAIFSQAGGAVIVALTLYTAAVNAELLRSGILSLDKGQAEAARSLGLSYGQAMARVVLPQAFRRTQAPLIAQFTILVKDTSLGSVIGFVELLRRGQILFQRNYNPMEALFVVALLYFVINYLLGLTSKLVERRRPTVVRAPIEI